MKSFWAAGIISCLALADVSLVAAEGSSPDDSFSKEGLLKANVADLHDMQLVAHPDVALAPTNNVLWCGTLQLAWNEAIALVGEPLHFTQASPEADLLNRQDFQSGDLDPGSYVAVADFERNHVEAEIRAALEKTFHGAASPELIPTPPQNPRPEDFVAYAYLYKNLAFAHRFADDQDITFAGQRVAGFGFDPGEKLPLSTIGQVWICDYQSEADFVVELQTKSAGDELILAKVAPGATLQATIDNVLARVGRHSALRSSREDTLKVPKLNFDLRRDFSELEGLTLQPDAAAKIQGPLVIAKVEQLVRFQLNEKGAVLKSEAVMNMVGSATGASRPRHVMIFDQPFLILMRQAGSARPYFALWVGNASLLVPAK